MKINWTYENCYTAAKQCSTLNEFILKYKSAYSISKRKQWIENFTWLQRKKRISYTEQECYLEAKKYNRKVDFQVNQPSMYKASYIHGWLKNYTWMNSCQFDIEFGKIYFVYKYEFKYDDKRAVYVGITLRPVIRDYQHRDKKRNDSQVLKFAKQLYFQKLTSSIIVPPMDILKSKITQTEAKQFEYEFIEYYKKNGYLILNIAKTGIQYSSVGGLHRKWTKNSTFKEAQKYKTIKEFRYNKGGAYLAAIRHGWLKDYTWLIGNKHCQ